MDEIDLVIWDMIMPYLGDMACFQAPRSLNLQVRVLIIFGYTKEGILGFVKKTYRRVEVAKAVQDAINRP